MQGKHRKRRVRILVKAFPQPSTKHEETVCCAGVTEDGQELLCTANSWPGARHGQ